MNRFFMKKWSKNDSKVVDKSVEQIQKDVEIVLNENNLIEKQIRIETKKCQTIEDQIQEVDDKYEKVCQQFEDNLHLKDQLLEDIERETRNVNNLQQTDRHLDQMIKSLEKDLKQRTDHLNQQLTHFQTIKDNYRNTYVNQCKAYEELNAVTAANTANTSDASDDNKTQFMAKKKELKEVEEEIEGIEQQIRDLNETMSSDDLLVKGFEEYADPIRVIIAIAEVKLQSNHFQQLISMALSSEDTLEKVQKKALSESDDESEGKDLNINEEIEGNAEEIQRMPGNRVRFDDSVPEVMAHNIVSTSASNINPIPLSPVEEESVGYISQGFIGQSSQTQDNSNEKQKTFSIFDIQSNTPKANPMFDFFGDNQNNQNIFGAQSAQMGVQTPEPNIRRSIFDDLRITPDTNPLFARRPEDADQPNPRPSTFKLFDAIPSPEGFNLFK